MAKPKPSRDKRRQLIRDSDEFKSKKLFTRIEAGQIIGSSPGNASHLLAAMAEDGELTRKEIDGEGGACGRRVVAYCQPIPANLRHMSWRSVDNEQLGIAEAVCGR